MTYGQQEVLRELSFRISPGQFICVVGLSGTGKTSLINAIAGFIRYSGQIQVSGKVGVVFQDHAVFPWMTVSENIRFALPQKLKDDAEAVNYYLNMAGLQGFPGAYPGSLSGGQIQRVGIARALAAEPAILLMDEPFGSLDSLTREKMQSWLLDIQKELGRTVLLVTHDIEEAVFLGDRVLILDRGKITGDFPIQLPRPRTPDLRMSPEFIRTKALVLDRFRALE